MLKYVTHRWMVWTMVAVIVVSVGTWWMTRDHLPREIRIATAKPGGLYHKFGQTFKPLFERQTGRKVTLVETQGTRDNVRRLLEREVEMAIVQSGAVATMDLEAVAPLYHDAVFVIARRGRGIENVRDLAGKRVAMGTPQSGMRVSAQVLIDHYAFTEDDIEIAERYFLELATDEALDAAIVTTGLINPDLEQLLASGDFQLVPVDEAEAFCIRNPSFRPFTVPRGLYAHEPSVPDGPMWTVATTALLMVRRGESNRLVDQVMHTLYENDVAAKIPTMIEAGQAVEWTQPPLHAAARRYFDPYGGIDILARFLESIAAGKELLFALAAGAYLLWVRWKRVHQRRHDTLVAVMKERLDGLLNETLKIERAQMTTSDPGKLKDFLDEVTRIKLKALDELTHEDLRGDRMFMIFLVQCGNLINKIQAKIAEGVR